jgi:hypothetical protein
MPPQQPKGLLDLGDELGGFGAHGWFVLSFSNLQIGY